MQATSHMDSLKMKRQSKLWDAVVRFLPWFTGWYNRMEVTGVEHLPVEGKAGLVCPNHPGILDPVYVHIAVFKQANRWLRWLGWADLMTSTNPVFKWIVQNVGTVTPVEEHHGTAKSKAGAKRALDALEDELERGHLVGLFPEGANHNYQDIDTPYKFHTGAIRLAAKTGAPIIPTAVLGTHKVWPTFGEVGRGKLHFFLAVPFWFPARVQIHFGEPFYVDPAIHDAEDPYPLLRSEAERLKAAIYDLVEAHK